MNIREAAAASGLTPDTIRFYERQGVLPAPPRQPNGYRHYAGEHVATLRLAAGLRQLGVPLQDAAPILDVAHRGVCGDIRTTMIDAFSSTLGDLDRRLEELSSARDQLAQILAGLRRMRPRQSSVPGVRACACVRMVTEA